MSAADENQVPDSPETGDGHTEAVFAELTADLELDTDIGDAPVALTPELRATFMSVEALAQCASALHASPDLYETLQESYPADMIRVILWYGPLAWLHENSDGGEDRLAVLDMLTDWSTGWVHDLGRCLGEWLEAHLMPEHIHLWVQVPGIGFVQAEVGYGEHANLLMHLPKGVLNGDNDD